MSKLENYPDHRALKYFRTFLNGQTNPKPEWSSRSGAQQTSMVEIDGAEFCLYCARPGLPIQGNDFTVIGHCCACTAAMDEVEFIQGYREILKEQEHTRQTYLKNKPTPSEDAVEKIFSLMYVKSFVERFRSVKEIPSTDERIKALIETKPTVKIKSSLDNL